jgi:hypothetical protein
MLGMIAEDSLIQRQRTGPLAGFVQPLCGVESHANGRRIHGALNLESDAARIGRGKRGVNAFAKRFVQSVKTECLGRMIFLGEDSLRYAVTEYIEHHHHERTHQGKDNRLLFPLQPSDPKPRDGPVQCRERLGGLLKFYYKEAA